MRRAERGLSADGRPAVPETPREPGEHRAEARFSPSLEYGSRGGPTVRDRQDSFVAAGRADGRTVPGAPAAHVPASVRESEHGALGRAAQRVSGAVRCAPCGVFALT
ncbi:hypothetical protein GCM10010466_08910 [Planomonospora alba]|uniref:Uncharacterized protein n=1 Tax=Planomonospora alba TaxID=161354 RepID=A0ABP6MN84_9ACTN